MTVNGVTYEHKNLDCLPKGFRLQDIIVKEVPGGIAFPSEHARPSNFYPINFELLGRKFNSGEQAFQYICARRNNCPGIADKVLRAKTAREAKKAAVGIRIKPRWDKEKDHAMQSVIEAKFKSSRLLSTMLLETGGKTLRPRLTPIGGPMPR